MRYGLLLALLVGLVSASIAGPADDGRGGEFGVLAGSLWPDQALAGAADNSPRPALGLRGGSVFGPHWIWYIDGIHSTLDTESALGEAASYIGRTGVEWLPGGVKRTRWFVTGGAGWMRVDFDQSGDEDFYRAFVSGGLGQRITLAGRQRLRWELRYDVTVDDHGLDGQDLSQGLALLGWVWAPPSAAATADADRDGVRDKNDRCPNTTAGLAVDKLGCSPDADRDGVADSVDRCPNTEREVPVDASGCPPDADGDGVQDRSDACPATPPGARVDDWGCPDDADRDGVADAVDACRSTPPGARVDGQGCPLDADGDGVYDGVDRCAATPQGTTVDDRGCPAEDDD